MILRPLADYGTELDLVADSMVDLIDENGQTGEFADQVAQLIGLPVLLVIALFKHTDLTQLLLNAIQYHLFRICDGH